MLQDFAGIERYDDSITEVTGIPFSKDDILIANIRPYLKKVWKAEFSGACSADVLALHSSLFATSDFLYHTIARDSFISYVMSGAKGSKMPRGDKTYILDYDTYIPSEAEQEKISKIMDTFDERIEKQRQLVEALKSYKRGLLNHIFGKCCDSSWQTVTLSEICCITMGQSPDSASYNIKKIGLPLVQGNADISDGITTPQRYTSSPTKTCESGAVILSVRAPVGSVSRANQKVCLGRGVCAITSENTDFIYQLLIYHQGAWKRIEQGGTFTAISGDNISSFMISIPNNEEQNRISCFLSKYDTKVRKEETALHILQTQKKSLLQQLFI